MNAFRNFVNIWIFSKILGNFVNFQNSQEISFLKILHISRNVWKLCKFSGMLGNFANFEFLRILKISKYFNFWKNLKNFGNFREIFRLFRNFFRGTVSPLCSFSCSLRCFLKLKDFPHPGSEQTKVFWCTCWYFWWCCRILGRKTGKLRPKRGFLRPISAPPGSSHSGIGGWRRFYRSRRIRTGGSRVLLPSCEQK